MKCFQIGFNKCGTLSLHEFFEFNGVNSIHYDFGGIANEIKTNLENGERDILGKYAKYDFLCDMEFICDWEHPNRGVTYAFKDYLSDLDKSYPNSKFILNTRSLHKWLRSRKRHAGGSYIKRYMNIYGYDENEVIRIWTKDWYEHHNNVVKYFFNRPNDLLILDLEVGVENCREQLRVFLGEGFDYEHFGHTHKTK